MVDLLTHLNQGLVPALAITFHPSFPQADDNAPCGMVAKLIDFGLAMALDPTATHVSNFTSGTP